MQRRRRLRNVQGARGVAGTNRESASAGIESGAGSGSGQTTQVRIGGNHQRGDGRIMRANVMAPGLRGGLGMTRMVHPGVADITLARRMRTRRGVDIDIPAHRGAGVPVDPLTGHPVAEATLLLPSGPARFLLRTLKMKVFIRGVVDAGRALGVLTWTMHPVPTRTRDTKGARTATTLPADAGTDHARARALPRKHLARRRRSG